MRPLSATAVIVFSALLSSGCVTTYYYNQQAFKSSSKALEHQRTLNAAYLLDISQTDSPIGGKALLVIPTKELCKEKGVKKLSRERVSGKIKNYICDAEANDLDLLLKALQKRQLFDSVELLQSSDPESTAIGEYDYLLYYQYIAVGEARYYFKSKEHQKRSLWPWGVGPSQTGAEALITRLDSLAAAIREL